MTNIIIEYQDGIKVKYTVPDYISDAIESLIMYYKHTVLSYGEAADNEQ